MDARQIFIIACAVVVIVAIALYHSFHATRETYKNATPATWSPRVAIVTAIYGNYDNLKAQHVHNADKVDWYCFTDNVHIKDEFGKWKIITTPYHLQNDRPEWKQYKNDYPNIRDDRTMNMMSAKYYKAQTHNIEILNHYDYYIWIDGSIFLREGFIDKMLAHLKTNDLISFKHSKRENIKDELDESVTMAKYHTQDLPDQYDAYIAAGFNDDIGLFENTIMAKRNIGYVNKLFDEWWIQNLEHSYQDQISYPFALWKTCERPYVIDENVFNNDTYSYTVWDLMKNTH